MRDRKPLQQEVLVVDDDAGIRDAMTTILQMEGYAVSTCASGGSVLARIPFGPKPSVIVLDLSLRDMSGGQCLRAIRESTWSEVPVLILSGWGYLERFGLDADGVVGKGVDPETVLRAVDRLARLPARPATSPPRKRSNLSTREHRSPLKGT